MFHKFIEQKSGNSMHRKSQTSKTEIKARACSYNDLLPEGRAVNKMATHVLEAECLLLLNGTKYVMRMHSRCKTEFKVHLDSLQFTYARSKYFVTLFHISRLVQIWYFISSQSRLYPDWRTNSKLDTKETIFVLVEPIENDHS
jgi:hypothetical protein